MTAHIFSLATLSEAEMFQAFCEHEHQYGAELTNRSYYFFPAGVPMEEGPFHEMMDGLGERVLASDTPIDLLERYRVYLERCHNQLGELIDAAVRHRAMSREIVMRVNRKHRVRVPAATGN